MNCCLVYPRNKSITSYDKPAWRAEHLGLSYVAEAIRRAGHNVDVINAAADDLDADKVVRKLVAGNYDFCGFSPTCLTIRDTLDIAEIVRHKLPHTHISLGGHHATHCALKIMQNHNSINSVVRGYADASIVKLLSAIERKDDGCRVKGIYYRNQDGCTIQNDDLLLSEIPFPKYYPKPSSICRSEHSYVIHSSRGCYNHCSFCSTPRFGAIHGLQSWLGRNAEDIVDEIEFICESDNSGRVVEISILDDNFIPATREGRERARQIAKNIISRNLKVDIWAMLSARAIVSCDDELLTLLYQAGLRRVLFGVEAGENETLITYRKPSTRDENLQALNLLLKFSLSVHATSILFHPYANMEEIRNNADFIEKIHSLPGVCSYTPICSRLLVFPGTSIYDRLLQDGMVDEGECYLNPYAYTFKDHSVAWLADHMRSLEAKIAPLYWLLTDINNYFAIYNIDPNSHYMHRISITMKKARSICYEYFIESAGIAYKSDGRSAFPRTEQFIDILMDTITDLSNAYSELQLSYTKQI